MSTLYYTFGVGTAAAMHEQLTKMKQSEYLVCIVPPKEFLLPMVPQSEEEMRAVLADHRLVLIAEPSLPATLATFSRRAAMLQFMAAVEYFDMGNAIKGEFPMQKWRDALEEQMRQMLIMVSMLFNTNRVSIRNYFLNAYESLLYQNWESVANKIDRPLVVIGMGPSMAREIETLRALIGKVYIVATDNSLRYLTHHGITPDFVVQVEWQPRSLDFYHGVSLPEKCTLVVLPGASPDAVHLWKGPKLFMPNYQIHGAFGQFVDISTQPFFGSNVGTLAIQFAHRIRAKEAWLIGFDFGAPQAGYFHPGSVTLHEVYPTVTRFWSVQKMDFTYNNRQQETILSEDRTGKPMWTYTSFESDKRSIEHMIATSPVKFFNCSEYGRNITGAEYRPLKQLTPVAAPAEYGSAAPDPYPLKREDLVAECDAKIAQLQRYDELSAAVLRAAESVMALHDHGQRTDTALKAFHTAIEALQSTDFNWIEGTVAVLDPGIRHVFTSETIRIKDLPSKSERLLAWANIVEEFYPAFARYNPFILDFLNHVKSKASV